MRRLARASLPLVVVATVACDQLTKRSMTRHLAGHLRHSYLGDTLRLEYAENPGAFLSLGAALPPAVREWILVVGGLVLLIAFALLALRPGTPWGTQLGASLVVAGGISNLADRMVTGRVVDFLNVGFGAVRTGVFNVADMAILLGVACSLMNGMGPARPAAIPPPSGG